MGDKVHQSLVDQKVYDKIVQKIFSDRRIILERVINFGEQGDEQSVLMDQKMKVDVGLDIARGKLKKRIYIQEHTRDSIALNYNDITITAINPYCNAEFEMTAAHYMIYVITDAITKNNKIIKPPKKIKRIVVVDIPVMDRAIMNENINYETKKNFKNQYFFTVPISELEKINALVWLWEAGEKKNEREKVC